VNYKFDVAKNRKKFFMVSGIITLIGIFSLLLFQMNLGVDFTSGTRLNVYLGGQEYDQAQISEVFEKVEGVSYDSIQSAGNNDMAIIQFKTVVPADQIDQVREAFATAYGDQVSIEETTVDPVISRELAVKAIQSIALASIGIVIYVTIRFEYRFAMSAIVALLHDAFIVISIFSIFRLEVNLPFVAAILTIVGYSINDTIVIFDRIRENLRTAKIKKFEDLADLVNQSVWQTMTRSINTVLTVIFTAAALFLFGSESIRLFSFALLIGLISGGYSSIFIAGPLWLVWRGRSLVTKPINNE
jgi:preprotein translocase subunit SecF